MFDRDLYDKQWREANKEKRNQQARNRYNRLKAAGLLPHQNKSNVPSDEEKRKKSEYDKRWYSENRERKAELSRLWFKEKGHIQAAINAARRAMIGQATPKWLSKQQVEQIKSFYLEARQATETTGIQHDVDHIVPIKGKTVCGLHVPWNLQVLEHTSNISKGNRLEKGKHHG